MPVTNVSKWEVCVVRQFAHSSTYRYDRRHICSLQREFIAAFFPMPTFESWASQKDKFISQSFYGPIHPRGIIQVGP